MKMNVCFIILNYNGFADTKDCVISLFSAINMKQNEIVIIDNGSKDDSYNLLSQLKSEELPFHLIETGTNLGYARGNNIGIKYALNKGYKYVCILNNDTIIEENFLKSCIDYLETYNDVAFVGPTLLNYNNNRVQSTGGDIHIKTGKVTQKNSGRLQQDLPEIIEADYVGGACIIFSTRKMDKLGFIPEDYFLFFEETEWCYQAKKKGLRNVVINSTYIRHKGSASINKIDAFSTYMMNRNRVVFVRRNVDRRMVYWLFLVYNIARIIHSSLKYDVSHIKEIKYSLDGAFNLVDKNYSFIKIEKSKVLKCSKGKID